MPNSDLWIYARKTVVSDITPIPYVDRELAQLDLRPQDRGSRGHRPSWHPRMERIRHYISDFGFCNLPHPPHRVVRNSVLESYQASKTIAAARPHGHRFCACNINIAANDDLIAPTMYAKLETCAREVLLSKYGKAASQDSDSFLI